jgi:hypothetical protein
VRRRRAFRQAGRPLPRLVGLVQLVVGGAMLVAVAALALTRSGEAGAPPAPPLTRVSEAAQRTVASVVPSPRPHVRARPAPRPAPRPAKPAKVVIPAIGVRARIVSLGLNPDRTLEVPEDFDDAGWWTGGHRPGERGPAVIAGHVDSTSGPAVFYRLGDLRPGDAIVVLRRDGTHARFAVQRLERYPKSNFPTARVYSPTRRPTLRLITCGGAFDDSTGHYHDNTVVYAVVR